MTFIVKECFINLIYKNGIDFMTYSIKMTDTK
jgi:hypothetical protein